MLNICDSMSFVRKPSAPSSTKASPAARDRTELTEPWPIFGVEPSVSPLSLREFCWTLRSARPIWSMEVVRRRFSSPAPLCSSSASICSAVFRSMPRCFLIRRITCVRGVFSGDPSQRPSYTPPSPANFTGDLAVQLDMREYESRQGLTGRRTSGSRRASWTAPDSAKARFARSEASHVSLAFSRARCRDSRLPASWPSRLSTRPGIASGTGWSPTALPVVRRSLRVASVCSVFASRRPARSFCSFRIECKRLRLCVARESRSYGAVSSGLLIASICTLRSWQRREASGIMSE
mmetsp:Transcript_13455/g.50044  ORF Transcript_13455/g.50044 Transcript_13455/m.50044 type:complete len:293 (-) Transcript_13455:452-1330(-)